MLGGMQHTEVLAYMDDLLIPSETVGDGLRILERVLVLMEQAGLKINLSKCSFLQTSINYLGHELSAGGVRPGEKKIAAVENFPIPTDVHSVRQFLGLAGYFRKYVKGFAKIARPLTELTKKNKMWHWSDDQQKAFLQLKESLISRPVLATYSSSAATELHTDACKIGVGAILLQQQTGASGDLSSILARLRPRKNKCITATSWRPWR